jgi:hypothetical protein
MTKRTHLGFAAEYGQQFEKRYRREGQITALVTLVGLLAAVFCSPLSDIVGSVLRTDVNPALMCILGIVFFFWGCMMMLVHYFRSTEDLVREEREQHSLWDLRGWYRN